MMTSKQSFLPNSPAAVLSLSGHDPTGGAGIQADIQAIALRGVHACTVITSLTAQDTCNVTRVFPQEPAHFLLQARTLLADIRVTAIKIGLLGSEDIALAVTELLREIPGIPVVLDPVLAAGGGLSLARQKQIEIMRTELIPRAMLVTPNSPEARSLTGLSTVNDCACALLDMGCSNVLLTGGHEEEGAHIINRWYQAGTNTPRTFAWPRLPDTYHGSGCTLAAAAAAGLAIGEPMETAIETAQALTWEALKNSRTLGRGQRIPNRQP